MQPFISVVIPAYNEEKYLPDCLTALKNQDYPKDSFEIVLVSNNSTDRTVEIATQFGARVLHEKTQGYVFTLNHGLTEAKGEIACVVDADTLAWPNWLSAIAQALSDPEVVGVTGSLKYSPKTKLAVRLAAKFYNGFVRFNFFLGKPHLTGFNLAVKKAALEKIGGLNTDFIMSPDIDLGMRLKTVGKVIYDPKMAVVGSMRRWEKGYLKTFYEYAKGYIYSVWLRRNPAVKQTVVR